MNHQPLTFQRLIDVTFDRGASDLHLSAGVAPILRVNGYLHSLDEYGLLAPDTVRDLAYSVLTHEQRRKFEAAQDLDFSVEISADRRVRGNLMKQRGALACNFRAIEAPPGFDDLDLPPIIRTLCDRPRGLLLITGASGSGKSTTLAALVDYLNTSRALHLVTIEDPIEFVHDRKQSLIHQREVGTDVTSFAEGLRHVVRQDPDVILVGELRDLTTISHTITAAETGHLVLGTLHTATAASTIDRIIDVFPPHQQQQIRLQFANTLLGVMAQSLVRKADGSRRVLATEVLVGTPAVRNLIREGKTHQVAGLIPSSVNVGMHSLEMSLKQKIDLGKLTLDEALACANEPAQLQKLCEARPLVAR